MTSKTPKKKIIDKINEQTKKANSEFAKMSKAQKKVAIAKDVLKSLSIKKYKATTGTYIEFKVKSEKKFLPEGKCDITMELQPIIQSDGVTCNVCAIGSIFASKVNLGNKCQVEVGENGWKDGEYIEEHDDREMIENLKGIFTETELRAIEYAFEGKDVDDRFGWDEKFPEEKYEAFFRKYRSATKRMIAIMENIIKNEGIFKP